MTLEEAGEAIGMSHAQLGRIERRLQKYNQELLEDLAKLYETRVSSLIEPGIEEELGAHWEEAKQYIEFLKSRD